MRNPTTSNRIKVSPALIGVGILVIAIGFGLPQLAPNTPTLTPNTPTLTPNTPTPSPSDSTLASSHSPPPPSAPALGISLLRLAGGLVVVCALCVIATRYLVRQPRIEVGMMEVLASLPIGPQCAIHLVQAGDRRLLLGTDPGGVKSLVELPRQEVGPEEAGEPLDLTPPDTSVDSAYLPEPTFPKPTPPINPPSRDEILAILARLHTSPRISASSSD